MDDVQKEVLKSEFTYNAEIDQTDQGIMAVYTTTTKGNNPDSRFGTNLGKSLVSSCIQYATTAEE